MESDLYYRTVTLAAGRLDETREREIIWGVPVITPVRSGEGWGRAAVVAVEEGR